MTKPKVLLAVGHGVKPDGTFDPGAVSRDGRWTEQSAGDIVVRVATADLAKICDVTGEADRRDANWPGSAALANRLDVDVAVEIHHDWNGGIDEPFGHWMSTKGQALATAIVHTYRDAGFGMRESWHRKRSLGFLTSTDMPAALIELGRIGQYTPDQLVQLGHLTARGIATYFGLTIPAPKPPKPDPTPRMTTPVECLAAIKDELGIKVGHVWDPADFDKILERVRKLNR